MTIGLVVARYTEDVSWINEIQTTDMNVYIYNKSYTPVDGVFGPYRYEWRENIGNEAETYLWHMIYNYDHLDNVTLFVQGRPYDHVRKDQLQYVINNGITSFEWLAYHMLDCKVANECHHRGLPISEFYTDIFERSIAPTFNFGVGGQFAATRELIRSQDIARYTFIRDMVLTKYRNHEPWCILERIWDQVLTVF